MIKSHKTLHWSIAWSTVKDKMHINVHWNTDYDKIVPTLGRYRSVLIMSVKRINRVIWIVTIHTNYVTKYLRSYYLQNFTILRNLSKKWRSGTSSILIVISKLSMYDNVTAGKHHILLNCFYHWLYHIFL